MNEAQRSERMSGELSQPSANECPIALFAAAMSPVDTSDNTLRRGACGWAFVKPVRKLYCNMTITFVSLFAAITVGSVGV
jgi:high-affinity nickel permease